MKRFLICILDDEHYTDATYLFGRNLDDAKKLVYENLPDINTLAPYPDNCKIMNIDIQQRQILMTTSDYDEKFRFCATYNENEFTVYEIIPVELKNKDYICILHHAYNGVDFYIEKVGTFDECFAQMQNIKKDFKDSVIDHESENSLVIDTGEEWFVVDIIQYQNEDSCSEEI